jgi:hypothetical protein
MLFRAGLKAEPVLRIQIRDGAEILGVTGNQYEIVGQGGGRDQSIRKARGLALSLWVLPAQTFEDTGIRKRLDRLGYNIRIQEV